MIAPGGGRTHRSKARGGWALLWGVVGLMGLFTTTFVISTLASSSRRIADVALHRSRARGLADAGLELARTRLQDALQRGVEPAARGEGALDGTPLRYTVERTTTASGAILYRLTGHATIEGFETCRKELVRVLPASPPPPSLSSPRTTENEPPAPWQLQSVFRS